MIMNNNRSPLHSFLSFFLNIHPHETHTVFYSTSSFFFVLSAYFVVLPLRDEGAISLGIGNIPGLFLGSLMLTLIAAPLLHLSFLCPIFLNLRFFSASLVLFFILWVASSPENTLPNFKGFLNMSSTIKEDLKVETSSASTKPADWDKHGWFYISVRICFFLWVALLNLITISSTWARVADVMDNESGSRLFGFIGAGATFGQLFGSLFATGMAWLGPYLLLFASLMMEFAAQSSKMINKELSNPSEELRPLRKTEVDQQDEIGEVDTSDHKESSPKASSSTIDSTTPRFWALLDGFWLIWSSTICCKVTVIALTVTTPTGRRRLFAQINSFIAVFILAGQLTLPKVTVIALTVTTPTGRRRLFAQINSFIAVFILAGQLTLTGRILTVAGITIALCAAPFTAFLNSIAIAVWPTYVAVAISETVRKVVTYVVTRPGRELLFTVVSQDEKYKAKVCIDVLVQRFGDATAAGMYKLLHSTLDGKITHILSMLCLSALYGWLQDSTWDADKHNWRSPKIFHPRKTLFCLR
ncbi:putative MFS transporter superfamily [Helianthus annuus]|nr:putative MFS transporter superfamily [Helianthus annuus]